MGRRQVLPVPRPFALERLDTSVVGTGRSMAARKYLWRVLSTQGEDQGNRQGSKRVVQDGRVGIEKTDL